MIEVYRNSTGYITHTVYAGGSPTEVDNDLVEVTLLNPDTGERFDLGPAEELNLGRYRVRIPAAATRFDVTLKTYWHYSIEGEAIVAEEDVHVVTPYVSLDEISLEYPELAEKTYEELRSMERRVRMIVNQMTGQDFGKKRKSILINQGSTALADRLYEVSYFTVNGNIVSNLDWNLVNDGWLIQVTFPPGYYQVKSDTYLRPGSGKFSVYLHGQFGWNMVPSDINQAALMLIGDYFCSDAVYRQRGVQAIRAADWRLDFHDRAFEGTGNLDVDLLLAKYRAYNMVII